MSDQERDRVDVTFMYAVHDAFQRDLHHTAEDTHLWPVLRAKAADPAVLHQMEAEHDRLVPPPLRFLYRAVWRPRYLRTPRWQAPARAH
ncbi:hemerythrin domain-containing protein [Actinomadura sp. B10D3]|uniref:hemerythrin domain-containing protein n=1 Tax=Actinomadura sp. B10D3 TaxID=3153557 RepID=UPI00325F7930